jgi:hypothetical protein
VVFWPGPFLPAGATTEIRWNQRYEFSRQRFLRCSRPMLNLARFSRLGLPAAFVLFALLMVSAAL